MPLRPAPQVWYAHVYRKRCGSYAWSCASVCFTRLSPTNRCSIWHMSGIPHDAARRRKGHLDLVVQCFKMIANDGPVAQRERKSAFARVAAGMCTLVFEYEFITLGYVHRAWCRKMLGSIEQLRVAFAQGRASMRASVGAGSCSFDVCSHRNCERLS